MDPITRGPREGRPRIRRSAAAALSLLAPGLGQLYAGRPRRALFALGVWLGLILPLVVAAWYAAGGSPLKVAAAALFTLACAVVIPVDAWRLEPSAIPSKPPGLVRYTVGLVLLAFAAFLQGAASDLIRAHFLEPFRMPGHAMQPTLLPGDRFFLDRQAFRNSEPRRGDVVAYAAARSGSAVFPIDRRADLPIEVRVGRITGVSGDTVPLSTGERVSVEPGRYFITGDNSEQSHDSRYFGTIERAHILGRIIYIWFSRDPSTREIRWSRFGQGIQ